MQRISLAMLCTKPYFGAHLTERNMLTPNGFVQTLISTPAVILSVIHICDWDTW